MPDRFHGNKRVNNSTAALIVSDSLVTLNFSLSLINGEVIDTNFDKEPASFRIGDGNMLPGFEEELLSLAAGDEIKKIIPSLRAFGEINPKNIQRFPIDKFKHLLEDDLIPTEKGSVISFKDPAGFDLPGIVKQVTAQEMVVDFNHPLAGKDIVFRAKVISVVVPGTETIEIKV